MSEQKPKLSEIEGRAEKSSRAPWAVTEWVPGGTRTVTAELAPGRGVFPLADRVLGRDAAFIAAARTDVPAMAAAIRAVLAIADAAPTFWSFQIRDAITDHLDPS